MIVSQKSTKVKIGSICCLCVVGVLFHSTRKKHLCRDKLKPEFVADLRPLISCETITTAQNILAPNVAIPLDDVMMVTGLTRLSEGEFEYFLGTKEEADALGAEGKTPPPAHIVAPDFPEPGDVIALLVLEVGRLDDWTTGSPC